VGGLLYQAIAIPAPYFAGALGMVLAAWLSFGLSSLTGPAKPLVATEATAPPLA
jgi:hypothetical protein